ncbi:MAG: M28 family metallopeptidase [Gemmatimonadota bacterium]|nr:M28 family metallopeptidase [Gemmatimonadota bacterium]MDH3426939.1 M28 family metallopeptidase [Gemmatimonadota bacterium]
MRCAAGWTGAASCAVASLLFIPGRSAAQESAPVIDARPGAGSVMEAIVDSVSAERIEADIRTLAAFGTRNTMSDTLSDRRGIGAARRWIKAEFDRISDACGGCLDVTFQSSVVTGARRMPDSTVVVNVIAIQRGTTDPNRYVIMSGDVDSRASDGSDATTDAPGANDNASGMAGVIEAARVLTRYEFPASIVYAGLSGEEQGLFGGQNMAAEAKAAGWRIEAVLNNDMIGNTQGQNGITDNTVARVFSEGVRADETERMSRLRRFTGGEVDSPSRNLARYVDRMADLYIPNLDVMMIYRLDRFGRGGHHRPFNDVGYPAVRIMEANEDYRRQHQDIRVEDGVEYGDVVEEVEFDFAAKLTSLNAVTLAALAWAPPPPSGVEIQGAVRPSTTLRWEAIDPTSAPDLAGYRVYWRLTDQPQWQWSEFTAAVEHTLENVVIDNYIFGVAAVSETGFESPVVFPGPVGAFAPVPPPADSSGT